MRRLVAPALVILLAAVAGHGFARWYAAPAAGSAPSGPAATRLATEQRLMCPLCTGTRLDVCDRPICVDMKADIARRLSAGEAADSIVAGYRAAYGPAVLAASQQDGSAAVAPALLITAGLLIAAALTWFLILLPAERRRRDRRRAGWSPGR